MALGPGGGSFASLLCLKKRHSRREARSLVILNEQEPAPRAQRVHWVRVTLSGAFSGTTRRAGPHFPPNFVISRLFGTTKLRSFCLVRQKMRFQQ